MTSTHDKFQGIKKSNNKINYYQKCLDELTLINGKKTLLLHACCAPCASFPLEFLIDKFDITIFYNNSNIYPKSEYDIRLNELIKYVDCFNQENNQNVKLIITEYQNEQYTAKLEPLKNDQEGLGRCMMCYGLRMNEAYHYANDHQFDYFTTVMTISRQKDSQKINHIGHQLQNKYPNTKYLYSDFKKKKGIDRRNEIVKEKNLYNQLYCGCIFSYQKYTKKISQNKG